MKKHKELYDLKSERYGLDIGSLIKLYDSGEKILKNYRELCDILNIKTTGGTYKTARLKELEEYILLHKEGFKYVIDGVCIVKKDRDDKRVKANKSGKNIIYRDDIQIMMLDLLAQSKTGEVDLPANILLNKLGMVGANYVAGRKHILKLSEVTQVPTEICYDWYNNMNVQLKKKIESALTNLNQRALVEWERRTWVKTRNITIPVNFNNFNEIDLSESDEKFIRDVSVNFRPATAKEIRTILKIERKVLKELNCTDKRGLFTSGKLQVFQKKISKYLLEEANIEYYYKTYHILYNFVDIIDEINELNEIDEKDKIITQQMILGHGYIGKDRVQTAEDLNNKVMKFSERSFNTIHSRAKKRNDIANKLVGIQRSNEYINHTQTLSNTLIDRKATDITEYLEKPVDTAKIVQITLDLSDNDENIPF